MWKTIFKSNNERKMENSSELDALLNRANMLVDMGNIEGLKDLQKTIWRVLQSKNMLAPYIRPDHAADSEVKFFYSVGHLLESCRYRRPKTLVPLSESVVTFPWHKERILKNLGTIGPGRVRDKFQVSHNHKANYYWPLMLIEVNGGHHSIAQGILNFEGEVGVDNWFDLSPLIRRYRFNGYSWIDSDVEEIMCECECEELGMAWEIGRILMEHSSNPYAKEL